MADQQVKLEEMELYAWVGEDEYGSGVIGIKQGRVATGMIPIVATARSKVDQDYLREQFQKQANEYGKTIRLVRFTFAGELAAITPRAKGG